MAYAESIHADRSLRGLLRPCDDGSDIRILFAEAAKTVAMNNGSNFEAQNEHEDVFLQRKRLHPNYNVDTQFIKHRFPDDYTIPQWTVQAPTASSASTVADPEDQYPYKNAMREHRMEEYYRPISPVKNDVEPVAGKIYHAQLFERGQKWIECQSSMEKHQRSRLQSGIAALVRPPPEDESPNSQPQQTTLRADAPPFVSTGALSGPAPSVVPMPGLIQGSVGMVSGRAPPPAPPPICEDAKLELCMKLGELAVDLDFLDNEARDTDSDDEEILFNSSTIL